METDRMQAALKQAKEPQQQTVLPTTVVPKTTSPVKIPPTIGLMPKNYHQMLEKGYAYTFLKEAM
jgi:hypothetical protein